MDNFNNTLIVVFTLLDIWLMFQIIVQFREIQISCRFMSQLRCFILVGFSICCALLIVDAVNFNSNPLLLVMTTLIGLFFVQREGIGKRGFINKGVYISYQDVKKCIIQREEKNVNVVFTYRETIRKDRLEGMTKLVFDVSKENDVHLVLEPIFQKKSKKRK